MEASSRSSASSGSLQHDCISRRARCRSWALMPSCSCRRASPPRGMPEIIDGSRAANPLPKPIASPFMRHHTYRRLTQQYAIEVGEQSFIIGMYTTHDRQDISGDTSKGSIEASFQREDKDDREKTEGRAKIRDNATRRGSTEHHHRDAC